jgi:hypothetical protein
MLTEVVNGIADFVIVSGLIPLLWFVQQYYRKSPFDATELGVTIMVQKVAFASVIVILGLSYFLGVGYPSREWLRLGVFALVVSTFWADVANLSRYQRKYPFNMRSYKRKNIRQLIKQSFRP